MKPTDPATRLFVDIGGVLLTNGWKASIPQRTAAHFRLDLAEVEPRHNLTFGTYQEGRITLEEYLAWVGSPGPPRQILNAPGRCSCTCEA